MTTLSPARDILATWEHLRHIVTTLLSSLPKRSDHDPLVMAFYGKNETR